MAAGYGRALWCTDQIRSGRRATHMQVVAHALFRRLITPRGTLRGGEEETAYGFDVSGYIGATSEDFAAVSLPAQVRAELMKDDRVSDVAVDAFISTGANGLTQVVLNVTAVLADESGDFAFTVAATAVTTTLLGGVA